MKWGTGESAALRRMQALSREELQSMEVTVGMAREWSDFYVWVTGWAPENGSARGRAVLMDFAARLLEEHL
jgi:hypothetical protein